MESCINIDIYIYMYIVYCIMDNGGYINPNKTYS